VNRFGSLIKVRLCVTAQAVFSLFAAGCGRVGYELVRAEPLGSRTDGGADARSTSTDGSRPANHDAGGQNGSDDGGEPDGALTGPVPCTSVVRTVADECTELPALPVAPFIDGLPECGLPLYVALPENFDGDASAPDAVASYGVAWRRDGVYFFVRVTDPTAVPPSPSEPASSGDGVELYLDADGALTAPPAYDDPGTRRFVIAAPSTAANPEARAEVWAGNVELATAWTSSAFRAYPKSFGYVVEAFVTARDLGLKSMALAAGKSIAWDLAVNVSYPTTTQTGTSGHRLGRYFLRGGAPSPETNASAFCRPTLLAE
jgi:hypothetical protein